LKELLLHNKRFIKCIQAETIEKAVDTIASAINSELADKKPLFISLLNGAFMFTADLLKQLDFECNVSFVKLSSYEGTETTGNIQQVIGLTESIEGRTIVVVEDIVDSGTTLFHFLNELRGMNPLEVKVAAMFYKPEACKHDIKIDYLGIKVPNDFIVGYGLDYNGLGRNYKDLYKLKTE